MFTVSVHVVLPHVFTYIMCTYFCVESWLHLCRVIAKSVLLFAFVLACNLYFMCISHVPFTFYTCWVHVRLGLLLPLQVCVCACVCICGLFVCVCACSGGSGNVGVAHVFDMLMCFPKCTYNGTICLHVVVACV